MAMNLEALLLAIAIVESGDAEHPFGNDYAVGKAGEWSRYQIKPSTWKQFAPFSLNFTYATSPCHAGWVATNIVNDITSKLPPHLSSNEWWIAYSYRRGIAGALRDIKAEKPRKPWSDYATRVSNTYEDIMTAAETNRVKGKR